MTVANSAQVPHWYTYPPKQCYRDCSPFPYEAIPKIDSGDVSLYVHIPFCTMKCSFCSLFTSTGYSDDVLVRYVDHLIVECKATQQLRPASGKVRSIYFGGGTPSVLPERLLARLGEALASIGMDDVTSKTVEFSPDIVSPATAGLWNSHGFDRASIGAQSFDDTVLASMQRRHTARDTLLAIAVLNGSGFSNINVDLIFGHSNQTLFEWQNDVAAVLNSNATSCTFHPLATANKTTHDRKAVSDNVPKSLIEQMHLAAIEMFESAGWQRTSAISFSVGNLPNSIERQESLGTPTIGLGAGARNYFSRLHTSTLPFSRRLPFGSILNEYFSAVSIGLKPAMSFVTLSDDELIRRQAILQMHHGKIHETTILQASQNSLTQDIADKLLTLVRDGHLIPEIGGLLLSRRGATLASSIGLLLASRTVADRIRERSAT